jgi:protein-L-isoaspartate(D-aspartate) O-methyltransferase
MPPAGRRLGLTAGSSVPCHGRVSEPQATEPTKQPRLAEVLAATDRAHYWDHDPVRPRLPQTTPTDLIVAMLELLDPGTGQTVLEIGTGSGFSTALLARLVGPSGLVVSLDVDPTMIERAGRVLVADGITNVVLRQADGRTADAEHAPFDRIISWAQADRVVPAPWVEQIREGGIVVSPVRQEGRAHVIRYRAAPDGLVEDGSLRAGFGPLTAEPWRPWLTE